MSIEIFLLRQLINEAILLNESDSYKKLKFIRAKSIKRSLSFKKQNKVEFKECSICLEKYQAQHFPRTCQCEHSPFCYNCSQDLIKIKIIDRSLITCEIKGCDAPLDTDTEIYSEIDSSLKSIFNDTSRLFIHKEFNCRKANCVGYFNEPKMKCDVCELVHCQKCLEREHENDCFLNNLLENSQIKACPGCKIMIEKDEGCNHIICPCRYEFCFVCCGEWTKMHHFCSLGKPWTTVQRCCVSFLSVMILVVLVVILVVVFRK